MKTVSSRQLLITFIPSLAVLAAVAAASALFGISTAVMTRDVTAIANINSLSGFLSNLGILLWCAAASVALFAAIILRNADPDAFRFLLCSALLSAYLLLDDLFQFHEASRHIGLDERIVHAVLGIAVSGYLIAFRRIISRTDFTALLLALGFLAGSVAVDAVLEPWVSRLGHWQYFLEDGAKWLGIACWCSYYVSTSHQFLVSTFGPLRNVKSERLQQAVEVRHD